MEKDLKIKTEWDLTPLLNGDDDPTLPEKQNTIKEQAFLFINKWKDRDDFLKDTAVLKEALDEYEVWQANYGLEGPAGFYFDLRYSQEQNNPNIKAKVNKISDFATKILNEIQFFELRLSKVPEEFQKIILENAALKPYHHFLKKLFQQAKYILSEPEERILNLKAFPAHANWVRMMSGFISKEEREILLENGKKEKKSLEEISSLTQSTNKEVRDGAASVFNEILEKYVEVGEAELNSILQDHKINDELRGRPRPDTSRLLGDDIEPEVVDAMTAAVRSRFDVAKNFYALKARLFGVSKLKYHERNVPYGNIDKRYAFDEAFELVHGVFQNLDPQFAEILESFAREGRLDVFPRKGKRGGAFCAAHLITTPVYVLLNFDGKFRDVQTLAHELGHGINDELMRVQNSLNYGTPLSTAEVASTFMEDFVFEPLLDNASDEERLAILMAKLNDEIATIFRQVACYQFEQELHATFREKGYLSKNEIGALFQKHMMLYMGDYVEQSPGSENWWLYWSHIRRFFYVYSYASGLLISKAMQNAVKKNRAFIDKVKEFLRTGLSDSPKNIFFRMGINIEDPRFWNSGLDETEKRLEEAKALSQKLGKI